MIVYSVMYEGRSIECFDHVHTDAQALKFAQSRYGKDAEVAEMKMDGTYRNLRGESDEL